MSQATVNKSVTSFIKGANQVTGDNAAGQPIARDMASTEISYINSLHKNAYTSITTDLKAVNNAEISTWEFDVTDSTAQTHIDELFTAGVSNKIKNSPHADTCIVIFPIDDRVKAHYNWVEISGSPRDDMVYILGGKVYVVPATKAQIVADAAATYAALDNRDTLYETEGSCSNGAYTDSATCIANSATWNSSVDPEEKTDIQAKYSALINSI